MAAAIGERSVEEKRYLKRVLAYGEIMFLKTDKVRIAEGDADFAKQAKQQHLILLKLQDCLARG